MFELKPISKDAIPAALAKAERYRLLNEPMGAESICRDVLELDAENEEALICLILSLADQLGQRGNEAFLELRDLVPRLASEYHRLYYSGLVFERRANSRLHQGGPGSGSVAYDVPPGDGVLREGRRAPACRRGRLDPALEHLCPDPRPPPRPDPRAR